jgi:hypothetical protein
MRKNKKDSNLNEEEIEKDLDFEEKTSKGIEILNQYKKTINEEREKRIGKTYDDVKTEAEKIQKKEGFYSKIRPIILTLIVLLIVALIYAFFTFGPILGVSLNKSKGINEKSKIDIVTTDEDIYTMYDSDFLVYSNQKITTYNSNCEKDWEYSLAEQFTPKIYVKNKYMVVSNNSNGTIYLFQSKQEILNKKIDGNIENIYLDDFGNMAIEYSTNGYKKIIGVYSKNGKNLYNAYLSSEGIIDIELLESGKKLLVVQSNSESFQIGYTVNIIDGTKAESTIKEVAKLDDNFVYDLTIQGQNIIMLLDNKVVKLNIDTGNITEIKKFDSSQLMFIDLSNNYYTYVEKQLNQKTDTYIVQTSRFDNSIIGTVDIDNAPKIMKNSGLLNYFIYQNSLQVINKWGIEIKNIPIDFPPKDVVIFDNQKSVALIYTNKVYVVTM